MSRKRKVDGMEFEYTGAIQEEEDSQFDDSENGKITDLISIDKNEETGDIIHNNFNGEESLFKKRRKINVPVTTVQRKIKSKNGLKNLTPKQIQNQRLKRFGIELGHLGHFYHDLNGERICFLSMSPEHRVVVSGIGHVTCLLGTVTLLGYKMKVGLKRAIFAPNLEAPLIIEGNEARTVIRPAERKLLCFNGDDYTDDTESTSPAIADEKFKDSLKKIFGIDKCNKQFDDKWKKLNIKMGAAANVLLLSQFSCDTLEQCLNLCCQPTPSLSCRLNWTSNNYTVFVDRNSASQSPSFSTTLPIVVPHSWRKTARQLCSDYKKSLNSSAADNSIRVMIIGPVYAGKNTLCRTLINSLLCCHRSPSELKGETKQSLPTPGVCLLDMDPQCPEQSLPGVVSCARHQYPLLGPAYRYGMHSILRTRAEKETTQPSFVRDYRQRDSSRVKVGTPIKEILLGTDKLYNIVHDYCAAAVDLMDAIRKENNNDPVIVNTPGLFDSATQLLNIELMRIVDPTHVIHILGSLKDAGTIKGFTSDHINRRINEDNFYNEGLNLAHSSSGDEKELNKFKSVLNYKFARLPSIQLDIDYKSDRNLTRDISVTAYFSSLWPQTTPSISAKTCMYPCKLPFKSFAILGSNVEPELHLKLITTAGWVGLCRIHPDYVVQSKTKSTNYVKLPVSTLNLEMGPTAVNTKNLVTLLGWALVKGVDVVNKNVQLYVPGSKDVLKAANVLAVHRIGSPRLMRSLFCKGNYTNMVYMDWPGVNVTTGKS